MKTFLFCIALSVLFLYVEAQNNNNYIPKSYQSGYIITDSERNATITEIEGLKDLTTFLPNGYAQDGSIDYTRFLQAGIDKYQNVLLPNFPILINDSGLKLRSNSIIIFNKYSKIILKASNKTNYNILKFSNISNVKLYYANIVGDRYMHLGKGGEWGMGIGVWNCEDIDIIKPQIINCWGDGIYINGGKNISIISPLVNNNRRNGISLISGDSILLKDVVATNTNGTLPMAGIDIEPNNNTDHVRDIIIENPKTYNNYRGILVSLYNLSGINQKHTNIQIISPFDDSSERGIDLYVTKKRQNDSSVSGTITITNPIWINQKENPIFYNNYGFGNQISINVTYSKDFMRKNKTMVNRVIQDTSKYRYVRFILK